MTSRNGPLIPGVQEFDRPRKSRWRWVALIVGILIAAFAIVLVLGVFAGRGPLRSLGVNVENLQVINWRPTENEDVIELAVTIPAGGLCRTSVIEPVVAEGADAITVSASVEQSKRAACAQQETLGDRTWVMVQLGAPVGERSVVRSSDGAQVKEESIG